MKPNIDTSLRTEGTLGSKRKAMTIDEKSLDRLMMMLTDLYSDPEAAVIREYPINGLDSHRAAGVTRPIEVTLPTYSDPTFVVRDYGTGLSEYEVMEHFAKYGWSSKLETNNEVGMMGLGCKAALTYTKQFALSAVKDGLMTEVLVLRAVDKDTGREVPSVEPVSVTPTNEPSGVTVYIPINNVENFNTKAREFFHYWKPGDVLVDEQEPQRPNGWWLDDDVLIQDMSKMWTDAGTTIVMGNIPYRVNNEHSLDKPFFSSSHVVVWVPIGSVDPTPAREALHYTQRTLETLATAREFLRQRVVNDMQTRLDECETHTEAINLHREFVSQLGGRARSERLTYRGRKVPRTIHHPAMWSYRPRTETARLLEHYTQSTHYAADNVYVVGHTTKTVSRRQRDKIHGYMNALPEEERLALLRKELYLIERLGWSDWTEGAHIIRWEDIEKADAIQRQVNGVPKKNQERTYWVQTGNDDRAHEVTEGALPTKERLVIASTRLKNDDDMRSFRTAMRQAKRTIVMMHPKSFTRFKREFPGSLTPKQAVYSEMRDLARSLSPIEFTAITEKSRTGITNNLMRRIATQDIHDKELLQIANALRGVHDKDFKRRWNILEGAAMEVGLSWTYVGRLKKQDNEGILDVLAKRYPLLCAPGHENDASHFVDYVNAMYELHHREKKT